MINGMIFPFQIVQFSKKNCNLSRKSVLGVFQSQIVRYFRICSDLDGFTERLTNIVEFVTLGFDSKLLKSRFGTLAIKHDFRCKFNTLNDIIHTISIFQFDSVTCEDL